MNIAVVSGVVMLALIVVIWMITRNKKDRRQLEDKLNRNYPAPREDKQDPDPEPQMK